MSKIIRSVGVPEGFTPACKNCALFDMCGDGFPRHKDYPNAEWLIDRNAGITFITPWKGGIDIIWAGKLVQKVSKLWPDACRDYEVSITERLVIPEDAERYKEIKDRAAAIKAGKVMGESWQSLEDEALDLWMDNL